MLNEENAQIKFSLFLHLYFPDHFQRSFLKGAGKHLSSRNVFMVLFWIAKEINTLYGWTRTFFSLNEIGATSPSSSTAARPGLIAAPSAGSTTLPVLLLYLVAFAEGWAS